MRVFYQKLCGWVMCVSMMPLAVAQVQEVGEAITPTHQDAYAMLVDSIHHLPPEQLVRAFEEKVGHTFSAQGKTHISQTIHLMQVNKKGSKVLYRAYFQGIAAALSSDKMSPSQLLSLLDMQKSAARHYTALDYGHLLQFLYNFFTEGVLYTTPQQRWQLEPGGGFTFAFEHRQTTPQQTEPIATEEVLLDTQPEVPLAEETTSEEGDDVWAEWGYEREEIDLDAQNIEDWNATEAGATLSWGKVKDPYSQVATIFDESALYEGKHIETTPMPPFAGGALLALENASLRIYTSQDSLSISSVHGRFAILSKQLQTTSATMPWPTAYAPLTEATLRFKTLDAHFPSGRMQAENTSLALPSYVSNEVEGLFQSFIQGNGHFYPIFRSTSSAIPVQLPYAKTTYQGGFTLRDSLVFGEAAGKQPGNLRISGQAATYLQATSPRFTFGTTQVYAQQADISVHHGLDSIQHPQVVLKYQPTIRRLLLFRDKPYHRSPFFSSYLEMYMEIDALDWEMDSDSLSLYLIQARQQLPAVFESSTFFSEKRYVALRGQLTFHPLLIIARFAKESKTNVFLSTDVSSAYKIPLKQLRSSVQHLHEQRYLDYDPQIDVIRMREKGFHYAFCALGYRDYDRLQIPSYVQHGPNATFHLSTQKMLLNGVKRFYFTPDMKVYADSEGSVLRLDKHKNFSFDGKVHSGTFLYVGNNFYFDYEDFKIDMPKIDSIRIQVRGKGKEAGNIYDVINGGLGRTAGTFYISPPKNRAGRDPAPKYPRFQSRDDSDIHFDHPRILAGAYDRSVRFVAPPFEVDSINDPNFSVVGYDGTFYAGGIIPPIYQKLSIMPDKSMGFVHDIADKSGYTLYALPNSHAFGELKLDLGGIQANGNIEHQTTTLYADKFTYYLDKVVAEVQKGHVRPGSVSGLESTDYPAVAFEQVKLLWQVPKDNMLLKTQDMPMQVYGDIAKFTGTLNVKRTGTFSSGTLTTDVVKVSADFLHLKEKSFTGRQANFEVTTPGTTTPAVRGKRIQLHYDLEKKIGNMHPEKPGVPSIDFPVLHMKTSMYDAKWDNNGRFVQMEKPENIPLVQSFFTSTRPDMKELSFQAKKATYSIDSSQLRVEGIPYIRVLDVDIIPKNHQVLVQGEGDIAPLTDATLYINATDKFHTFINGNITVHASDRFNGRADYQYINAAADTFFIEFDEFLVEKIKKKNTVVAYGHIPADMQFKASAGFYFKERVKMFANRKSLLLDGYVKLVLQGENHNIQWIQYKATADKADIVIDFDNGKDENGAYLNAGLHYNAEGALYLTFMQDKEENEDIDLFEPAGMLRYDSERSLYVIQPLREEVDTTKRLKMAKKILPTYLPKTFSYSSQTDNVLFEGPLHLHGKDKHLQLNTIARGTANLKKNKYTLDAILSLDMDLPTAVMNTMAKHMQDARSYLGGGIPQTPKDFYSLLAMLIGEKQTKKYEKKMQQSYLPLHQASKKLHTDFMFSHLTLQWDPNLYQWYSQDALQLAHIGKNEIRADLAGYLQIQPNRHGANVDLMLYFSPTAWYYIRYHDQNLSIYSGLPSFNRLVGKQSRNRKPEPQTYSFTKGSPAYTEAFVQDFSEQYRKNETPLDVKYPESFITEDNIDEYADEEGP